MSTAVSEQAILVELRQVPAERWEEVLHYLRTLRADSAGEIDPHLVGRLADVTWTASALLQWPLSVQNAILREQATRLIARYRRDPQFSEGVTWWAPNEVGRLPIEQRDIILEASATIAEEEYRTNPELACFDAFGEEDLYADSANSEFVSRDRSAADPR
jgi:hypothetical protein